MLIDRNIIKQLARDTGNEVLPALIHSFIDELAEFMPRLAEALDTDDYAAIARDIHSLKSSSGTFGAKRLNDLSEAMDAAYKADDIDQALALGVELHINMRETISVYRGEFPQEARA